MGSKLIPKIIYEDDDILVIDKPSGLVVNRAETVKGGWTVMDWIEENSIGSVPKGTDPNNTEFELRRGVVHRLDKDTSGVMVVAKNKEAFENIQKQFKERVVKKEYLALVHGDVGKFILSYSMNEDRRWKVEGGKEARRQMVENQSSSFYIPASSSDKRAFPSSPVSAQAPRLMVDAPIGRNPKNRMKWAVVEGGRSAVTEFEVISILALRGERLLHAAELAPSNSSLMRGSNRSSRENPHTPAAPGGTYSLVKCSPKSGRTHQIRVHLTALNCPVVGDSIYLNKRMYSQDKKWCPRLFLHASTLGFTHPSTNEVVEFKSNLPEELASIINFQ